MRIEQIKIKYTTSEAKKKKKQSRVSEAAVLFSFLFTLISFSSPRFFSFHQFIYISIRYNYERCKRYLFSISFLILVRSPVLRSLSHSLHLLCYFLLSGVANWIGNWKKVYFPACIYFTFLFLFFIFFRFRYISIRKAYTQSPTHIYEVPFNLNLNFVRSFCFFFLFLVVVE